MADASLNPSSASCNRRKQITQAPCPPSVRAALWSGRRLRCSPAQLTRPLPGCGSSILLHPKLEK